LDWDEPAGGAVADGAVADGAVAGSVVAAARGGCAGVL
jgi:hypothetical protein